MAKGKQSILGKPLQQIEREERKGQFRIVGVVHDEESRVVGYAIIDTEHYQLKLFNIVQTVALINHYPFVNATLESPKGPVVNTECSMSRLLIFNKNKQVIGNKGITILARVFDGETPVGFKILDPQGKVFLMTNENILKVTNKGESIPIINGKVVYRDGVYFVSAIKQEYTKAYLKAREAEELKKAYHKESKQQEDLESKKEKDDKEALRQKGHRIHLQKILKRYANNIVKIGRALPTDIPKHRKAVQEDIEILFKDHIKVKHPKIYEERGEGLSDLDLITLTLLIDIKNGVVERPEPITNGRLKNIYAWRCVNKYVENGGVDTTRYNPELIDLAKELGEEDVYNYLVEVDQVLRARKHSVETSTSKIQSKDLLKIATHFKSTYKKPSRSKKARQDKTIIYTPGKIDFASIEGIKEMGYAIHSKDIGMPYNSQIYGDLFLESWANKLFAKIYKYA
jgi:hypothetical protein